MKYQVSYISPVKAGKVVAAASFVVTLFFTIITVFTLLLNAEKEPTYNVWYLFFVPFFNALFSFIFGWVTAFVYNIVAKRVGGFELTLQEPPQG